MNSKLVASVAVTLLAGSAHAQTERSGNADARVMQQLQQVSAEKTQLKADNDRMKKELDAAKDELKKLQGEQAALKQKADSSTAALARATTGSESATAQVEALRGQLQELIAKYRENVDKLREVETDRTQARGELTAKQRALTMCVDRNVELFNIANETLDRLSRRGSFSAFSDHEPFTKLSRTRLDNLIEDYRYRVDELRMEKSAADKK